MRQHRPYRSPYWTGALAAAAALALAAGAAAETAQEPAVRLGDAWQPIPPPVGLGCYLHQARFTPGNRYAIAPAFATGFCVSHDGGHRWARWRGGESDGEGTILADGTLIWSSGEGFLLSRDFGFTRETRSVPGAEVARSAMHRDGRRGIAVNGQGVHVTEDGWRSVGGSWRLSSQKPLTVAIGDDGRTLVAVFAERSDVLSAVAAVSRDFGRSWTTAELPRTGESVTRAQVAFGGNGAILILADRVPFYSADGGRSWGSGVIEGYAGAGEPKVAVSANLATLLVADEKGVLLVRPAAAARWTSQLVLKQPVQSIALSDNGKIALVVDGEGALLISRDGARTWAKVANAPKDLAGVALSGDGTVAIVALAKPEDGKPRDFISRGR